MGADNAYSTPELLLNPAIDAARTGVESCGNERCRKLAGQALLVLDALFHAPPLDEGVATPLAA